MQICFDRTGYIKSAAQPQSTAQVDNWGVLVPPIRKLIVFSLIRKGVTYTLTHTNTQVYMYAALGSLARELWWNIKSGRRSSCNLLNKQHNEQQGGRFSSWLP